MIKIKIDDIEYLMSSKFSFADHKKMLDVLHGDNPDCKFLFAEFVHKKIICDGRETPNIDYLIEHCDFKEVMNGFFENDKKLEVIYNDFLMKNDTYEAFFLAVDQNLNNQLKDVVGKIPKIDPKVISVVEKARQTVIEAMTAPIIKNIGETLMHISDIINEFSQNVARLFEQIKIPTISDERKEVLAESFKKWGNYGWSILPHAPIFYYEDCPDNVKDAHKMAMRFCKKDDMQALFTELREMKGVKKSDLEEAIFDYENGKYKSCALILFALIDAKLIRIQNTEKSRQVGKGAVQLFAQRIKNDKDIEKTFITLLYFENIVSCLSKMFERGNDFRVQPSVINRNFIDHGMLTRNVLKRDCIQLFLLYFNLMIFLDLNS